MDLEALEPFGVALVSYLQGNTEAVLTVRREDGFKATLPVSHFFRTPGDFTPIEIAALDQAHGHVLDVGAGTGLHALALQSRGVTVTALDISPQAIRAMRLRGVVDTQCVDIFEFESRPFDTLLLLGHGIGIVGHLSVLGCALQHLRRLTSRHGQLFLHSTDVSRTDDPLHLAYHEANRRAGRYVGEIHMRFEFEDHRGPYRSWLHVDCATLGRYAHDAGWTCELIVEQDGGDYLARLTRHR